MERITPDSRVEDCDVETSEATLTAVCQVRLPDESPVVLRLGADAWDTELEAARRVPFHHTQARVMVAVCSTREYYARTEALAAETLNKELSASNTIKLKEEAERRLTEAGLEEADRRQAVYDADAETLERVWAVEQLLLAEALLAVAKRDFYHAETVDRCAKGEMPYFYFYALLEYDRQKAFENFEEARRRLQFDVQRFVEGMPFLLERKEEGAGPSSELAEDDGQSRLSAQKDVKASKPATRHGRSNVEGTPLQSGRQDEGPTHRRHPFRKTRAHKRRSSGGVGVNERSISKKTSPRARSGRGNSR